jgi:ATP-dependent helicase Lhr and Lhr-like helicase
MLKYIKKPNTNTEIFSILHPYLKKWFKGKFGEFSAPQKYGIMPIHNRDNTLIFAPTGTGKTLTAFTSIINELTILSEQEKLEDRVYCVYISPLKALSRDIKVNLTDPLESIKEIAKKKGKKIDIRVSTRTGDTKASEKAKMLRKPPHILITTPESFGIVLTSPKFRLLLNNLEYVIVDEIHSLASNKRGVHLSLSLERLQNYSNFTRIGLSATVSPLDKVAKFLVGQEHGMTRDCKIIDAQFIKKMDLKVLSPVKSIVSTDHETLHNKMYELINNLIQKHKTTLIFTNTRSATERVVHYLKTSFPKIYTEKLGEEDSRSLIGAHHGSLSTSHRLNIEKQLKDGQLKAIVSSTSLELGIDIGNIDLVILLGSPKSVARALQRIGRSGHQLHKTAKGRVIVLDRDDLVECSVLLKSAIDKKIDKINIPKNCLDVLAQQIYGMAISQVMPLERIYELVKQSYNYETLSRSDFDAVISYLKGDHVSLEERYVYAKIWVDEETGDVGKRGRMARVIYMTNIGTIPDESFITVKLGDENVGKIDEGFLEKLKRGDVFVLGGETYEFQFARGMTAVVKTSAGRPPTVPSWVSEMLPLSFDLALDIQRFRQYMDEQFSANKSKDKIMEFINKYLYVDKNGANSIYEYFNEQYLFSQIPSDKKIVIEHFSESRTKYVVFHTLFGRRVNDVLSRALAYAIARKQKKDVEITISDNGFLLTYIGTLNAQNIFRIIKSSELRKIMDLALNKTEVLKRRFRHCASRGMMILRNYMGRKKSVGKQQVSSMILLKAVERISMDFPMLREARREVMEDLMDIDNAGYVLEQIEKKKIKIIETHNEFPSPFSFHLVMQGYSDIFKIEDRMAFLQRMHQKVIKKIENPKTEAKLDYHELWRMMEENKERDFVAKIEKLKISVREQKLKILPLEQMDKVIDNDEIDQKYINILKENKGEIELVYPLGLKKHIFKYLEEYDYITKLHKQWEKAFNKVKFDSDLFYEGKQIINGKRSYISKKFRDWLEVLLKGAVPYAYENELSKFLMRLNYDMD